MSTADLLAKAQEALPTKSRGRYAHLVPVLNTLRQRGFTTADAVDWMIGEKSIHQAMRDNAYHSFTNYLRRVKQRTEK